MYELNRQQFNAVSSEGNVMIIAGPGTGKTRTLTNKIIYLLQEKAVSPNKIVALSFTKKAAAEMKERVDSLISNSDFLISKQNPNHNFLNTEQKNKGLPYIGTFHSLSYEILKIHGNKPKVATEKELAEIIRKICGNYQKATKGISYENIKRYISLYKTVVDYDLPDFFIKFVENYSRNLNEKVLLDYDDLLIKALEIVKKEKIKYDHILVDEFQDINDLQYELLKQLIDKNGDLFVIGDPKQSIYAFRGSNEKIFEKFISDYPEAHEIVLNKNYRSGENIIKTSSSLFKDSVRLKTIKKESGIVKLVETYNQYSEADWILKEINQSVGGIDLNYAAGVDQEKQTLTFADFAIVYRIHSLNKILEKKFYGSGIPFQVIGEQSLYEQKEIKFIILALQYTATKTSMNRFIEVKHEDELTAQIKDTKAVDDPEVLIKEKLEAISIEDKNVSELVRNIIDSFGLEIKLENKNIKQQNLKEFVGSTIRFNKQNDGLVRLLKYIKYLEEHDYYDERADMVTLLTMHAAKGLEFPYVFIIGVEEGIIPYSRSIEEGHVDEERRLLYVAMTRAQQELQLLFCQKRKGKNTTPSRFINAFSNEDLERIEDPGILRIKRKFERSKKKQLGLF